MPVRQVQEAMVSLLVTKGTGRSKGCGVAVAPGGLVVTTLDEVTGAQSVIAVTANGTRGPAQVVATDRRSDIALVRVPTNLRSARFAGDSSIPTGYAVTAMAMTAHVSSSRQVTTMWSRGTVRSIGSAVVSGKAAGMAGIDAVVPAMPPMAGELLLTPDGKVVGILDSSASPNRQSKTAVYLPSQLVLGVARGLASSGRIQHGWLGVTGRDTSMRGTRGALVVNVDPDGASAHVLEPGDVIVKIDGAPVRSIAELDSRLYTVGPGSRVRLKVVRSGRVESVAVVLGSSP
ncbi:MAG: S1C family serine protease [Acidimicrobiales bacterium]